MLHIIIRTNRYGLFIGLICCVMFICGVKADDMNEEQSNGEPWQELPLPILGVRQVDNTPLRWTETFVWVQIPQVEGYSNVMDLLCYEEPYGLELLESRELAGGGLELRHQPENRPYLILITEFTPQPGKVQIVARIELNPDMNTDKQITEDDLLHLNMCPSLVRTRGSFIRYDSYADPFPEILDRCFIFTDQGRTFLKDTVRRKMPKVSEEDPRNNPPWIQVYDGVWNPVHPSSTGDTWYNHSPTRFTIPILGVVSIDGRHLIALADDSSDKVCQAWAPCLHHATKWTPQSSPPAKRRWRINLYVMPNDPDMLLKRVAQDFPDAFLLQDKRLSVEQ